MHHDGRAKACFVGEDAALEAPGDAGLDGRADRAADDGVGREGILEDGAEDLADDADVAEDNDQAGDDKNSRHEGHELFGDLAETLDAADERDADDDRDDDDD